MRYVGGGHAAGKAPAARLADEAGLDDGGGRPPSGGFTLFGG